MATRDVAAIIVDGDRLDDGFFNDTSGVIRVEAGENITAGNVVYIHLTSGTAFVSDADGTANGGQNRANGIALTTATSGNDVDVQTKGKYVTTGLTDKEDYYLSTTAGALSTTRSGVRIGTALSTTELYINIVQDDRDAVGTIKPIAISLTGYPANNVTAFWVVCAGATLSDTESPLNGTAMPNLNSTQRFLRGSTTSGTTGGADTVALAIGEMPAHTHEHNAANSAGDIANSIGTSGTTTTVSVSSSTGGGAAHENRPAYYEVVFHIKIK